MVLLYNNRCLSVAIPGQTMPLMSVKGFLSVEINVSTTSMSRSTSILIAANIGGSF